MATYSAFFSSGLLASCHYIQSRAHTPVPPSSPILLPSSPGDPIDVDCTTPTPSSHTSDLDTHVTPNATHLNVQPADRPRLRKRRSSVTLGVSPMNAIKSPIRNASAALHRGFVGVMSPGRSRSGSLNGDISGATAQGAGATSRKRSSSGTTNIRPRRTTLLRRAPVKPPPNVPLPDIPSLEAKSPTLGFQHLSHSMQMMPLPNICISAPQKAVPRPPLASRSHAVHNSNANSVTKLTTSLPDAATSDSCLDAVYTIDEEMKEN